MPAKKKKTTEKKPEPTFSCFNCKKPVTKDDFCFGCKEYVCEPCNVGGLNVPWGGHSRDAHLEDDDAR